MNTASKILVFVPCYNCAPQIGRVITQLASAADRFAGILLLDNGSSDGTTKAAVQAVSAFPAMSVTIGRNHENYNLGGSHKAAFRYAHDNGYSHVIVLHGDDQGRIEDIFPCLDAGMHLDYDAVLGARFTLRMIRGLTGTGPRTLKGYSAFRISGNLVFNMIFSSVLMQRIPDLGSGLNIYGPRVLADRSLEKLTEALCYPVSLMLSILGRGMKAGFTPISWREEDQVSNVHMFSQALQTLALLRDYKLRRNRFLNAEHRSVPRTDYTFDIIHRQ